jgi:flagellar hook-associated protein 3 FlgL
MRVTTYMTRQQRTAESLRGQERLEAARTRVSTGKRIGRPSDSPQEIGELRRVRSEAAALERVRAGTETALPHMRAAETALGEMTALLRDVRCAALQAISGSADPEAREVLAAQVGRLRARLTDLGNTQFAGRAQAP